VASFVAPSMSNGAHSVTVRASDVAGNVTSKTVNFTIDDPDQVLQAAVPSGGVVKAVASKSKHHKYTLTVNWAVQLPGGASPVGACQGDVTISLSAIKSKRTKFSKSDHVALAPGTAGCTVTAKFTLKTKFKNVKKSLQMTFPGSSALHAFTLTGGFTRP
jgi:hypothetical protein